MLVFASIVVAACTLLFVAGIFSEDISEFLKAKTEELRAMTRLIEETRKEKGEC